MARGRVLHAPCAHRAKFRYTPEVLQELERHLTRRAPGYLNTQQRHAKYMLQQHDELARLQNTAAQTHQLKLTLYMHTTKTF